VHGARTALTLIAAFLLPVSASCSRRASRSVVRTSIFKAWSCPLTLSDIATGSRKLPAGWRLASSCAFAARPISGIVIAAVAPPRSRKRRLTPRVSLCSPEVASCLERSFRSGSIINPNSKRQAGAKRAMAGFCFRDLKERGRIWFSEYRQKTASRGKGGQALAR